MKEFLRRLFSFFPSAHTSVYPGVIIDDRPAEAKARDYRFEEIVAKANEVPWREKSESEYRTFPVQNQNGSGSCVAQTARKLLHVMYKENEDINLDFSASHIYQRRKNKPAAGMQAIDVFEILQKGTTLNDFLPSDNLTDKQMDARQPKEHQIALGETFKIGNYIVAPSGDIDTVASIIHTTGKAVMVWYYFLEYEWARKVPFIDRLALYLDLPSTLKHSVAAVDFTLHNGQKALVIDDSAHFGSLNRRIITADFHARRNFFSGYPMNFKFQVPEGVKPRYDGSVKSLQDCLKWDGVFPSNVESTGVLGPITKKAIADFQKKHSLEPVGTVGPKTTALLKQLFP